MKEMSKKTSCLIWGIISIFFGIGYEFICQKLEVYKNFSGDRIFIIAMITLFVGLHVIFGFKKLYNFIIEKRYIIAGIALIVLTILGYTGSSIGTLSQWIVEPEKDNTLLGSYRFIRSDEYGVESLISANQKNNGMKINSDYLRATNTNNIISVHVPIKDLAISLARPYNIGYFFLNFDMAFSLAWNIKFIALLLVTFEMFQIITNNKKYMSLIGTILIAFSSVISWWYGVILEIIIFGELALICIDKFMQTQKSCTKLGWSVLFAYSMVAYVGTLYPAWIISFGYVFLALGIWIIIKNIKEYKFSKIDLLCIVLIIGIFAVFLTRFYVLLEEALQIILNTSYPGDRNERGGGGIKYLFSYVYNFLLPFVETEDNMSYASMLSIFPVPIVMGLIYIYKKEKHTSFIFPMLTALILESVWCMVGFPSFLGKISLMNLVSVERCAIAVALGCIYLYMYMISNIEEKYITLINAMRITLVLLVVFAVVDKPAIFQVSKNYIYIFTIIVTLFYFLILNSTDKKYRFIFLSCVIILNLLSSIFVNPITKGTGIINETNFAKAIQNENLIDSDAVWITENMDMIVSNYLVANGAKTLNSTNTYPNEEFWKIILEDKCEENREIWNRYAHVRIRLTDEDTSINLKAQDKIIVNLNYDKLSQLNVKYIVSYKDENELENGKIKLNKVYENKPTEEVYIESNLINGIYIYEIVK